MALTCLKTLMASAAMLAMLGAAATASAAPPFPGGGNSGPAVGAGSGPGAAGGPPRPPGSVDLNVNSDEDEEESSSSSAEASPTPTPSPSPAMEGETNPWTTQFIYEDDRTIAGAMAESVAADGYPAMRITCTDRRDGHMYINPGESELEVRASTWVVLTADTRDPKRFRITPRRKWYTLKGNHLRDFLREAERAEEAMRITARDDAVSVSLSGFEDALDFLRDHCGSLG